MLVIVVHCIFAGHDICCSGISDCVSSYLCYHVCTVVWSWLAMYNELNYVYS